MPAARVVLRLAALGSVALAVTQVARVRELARMALLGEGAERTALVALLALVGAWSAVLVLSLVGGARHVTAGVLAQGLAAGALALVVVAVVLPFAFGGRSGGPLFGTMTLMLVSLVPQALALAAAVRGRRELRATAQGLSRARGLVVGIGAAAASFALNAMALQASSICYFTEARAIGDLRTLLFAEVAYGSLNDGGFGSPECLVAPAHCGARHPAEAPPLIDAALLRPVRCGYRFSFHPGPAQAPAPQGGSEGTPQLRSFAVTAVPVVPGVTGVRAFCADSEGVVWESGDGRLPPPVEGACAEGMNALR